MNYLFILATISSPLTPDSVHFYRPGFPTIVMTFEPGINHVEPQDSAEVDKAIEQCMYGYGPDFYPVRLHKIGRNDYQTVCGKIEDHRN